MASVFETLFAAAAVPAIAGTHGKTVTFLPKGGTPRPFKATAVRFEETQLVQLPAGLFFEDAVLVSCVKHATLGIDVVSLGDGITVGSLSYSFDRTIIDQLENNWTLRFILRRPYELGGNRQPA